MKSERNAAMIMLTAAMIGLVLANSPFGEPLLSAIAFKLDLSLIGIEITVGHVVSDLFLALFFLVAGLELKYELKIGTLSSPRKAMVPVIAALAGVIVPSSIYAYLNWGTAGIVGWPIPAATDIALGGAPVSAVLGLPSSSTQAIVTEGDRVRALTAGSPEAIAFAAPTTIAPRVSTTTTTTAARRTAAVR